MINQSSILEEDTGKIFTNDEFELISCAFKSQLKEHRHTLQSIDLLLTKSKFELRKPQMEKYKMGIIYEMCLKGKQQINIIDKYCLRYAATPINLIRFFKMQADIYRYMAEATVKYHDL